jgi:hypothetical protein
MEKFTANIDRDMAFFLSRDLKKSLGVDEAISSLSKARNLLENAGLFTYCTAVDAIIKRAQTIDESTIEVAL